MIHNDVDVDDVMHSSGTIKIPSKSIPVAGSLALLLSIKGIL
jgi:hypothetical protein